MNWIGRLMTSTAAVLVAASGASASTGSAASPADAAWAAAVNRNSLEAYAAFVMTYPDSDHARAAYDRLSGSKATSDVKGTLLDIEPIGSERGPMDTSGTRGLLRMAE